MAIEQSAGGRPPLTDTETLRVQLLEILASRGYEQVTMGELADAANISVRTLHRYFPAKADIAWGGIESSADDFRECLSEASEMPDTISAVSFAVEAIFNRNVEGLDMMRSRLKLIALSPELRRQRSHTFDGWRTALVEFIAQTKGTESSDLSTVALASSLHGAMLEGLSWWAQHAVERSPADCVREALESLRGL